MSAGSRSIMSAPTDSLIAIRRTDVPSYLRSSQFYLSLWEDEEESSISIPSNCMKVDDTVHSLEELRSLLLTLRFWMTGFICDSVLEYALDNPFELLVDTLSEFYPDLPALKHIEALKASKDPIFPAIHSKVPEFIRYCLKRVVFWPNYSCDVITAAGNVEVLKYALKTGCKISFLAATSAAANGHLSCLQLLHKSGAHWNEETASAAARGNHLTCLQYAHENGCPWYSSAEESEEEDEDMEGEGIDDDFYMYDSDYASTDDGGVICEDITIVAAANASLDCLKYIHSTGVPLHHRVMTAAVKHPQGLDCLKFGHQHGLRLTRALSFRAARNNNLPMLQFLCENDCPYDQDTSLTAVRSKSSNCLKYLIGIGCPVEEDACEEAAERGDVDTVLFFMRSGYPLSDYIWTFQGDEFDRVLACFLEQGLLWRATPSATMFVAKSGNLENLKRLVENGCPWDDDTCEEAAFAGSLECLQYAHENGAHFPSDLCGLMWSEIPGSSKRMSLECFIYAHQHGHNPLLSDYTSHAARKGQLELLKYLHEHDCAWHERVADVAAYYGHTDCLEYVLSHGCEYHDALYSTAKMGQHVECIAVVERYLSARGLSIVAHP